MRNETLLAKLWRVIALTIGRSQTREDCEKAEAGAKDQGCSPCDGRDDQDWHIVL